MTKQTLVAAVVASILIAPSTSVAAKPVEHPGKGHGAKPAVPGPPPSVPQPAPAAERPRKVAPPVTPAPSSDQAPAPAPDEPAPGATVTDLGVVADELADDAPLVGPSDPLADRIAAYGSYCAAAPRKKAARARTAPFAACVTALAKLAVGDAATPAGACRGVSKKKVRGIKGTPYSLCVKAAATLRDDLDDEPTTPVDESPAPVDEPPAPVDEPAPAER